jgi:prevent-host-death family protein
MRITTFTSREFNQNTQGAKRASRDGPVFITDRGHPAHVLLTMAEYLRLTRKAGTIADALAMPDAGEIEFDPPRIELRLEPANLE